MKASLNAKEILMLFMQNFTIFALTLIFLILILILLWKYFELKGKVEQRAIEIFEKWKEREIESLSTKKAEILFKEWKQKYEKEIRRDAIEKSKAVIAGKATEHLAPFLPNFKYNPKNVRFLGSPIDLIVFDGLDEGDLKSIVFVEIKYGKSMLTKREKQIKDIIERKKVRWELLRIDN